MKNVLIAGGDRIEPIISKLGQQGVKVISHLDGRKPKIKLKEIPSNVDIVLILTDYINHNLSSVIKKKAQNQAIPVLFSKRSWTSISTEMKKAGNE
ncbi:DUF2325 domain-containing protein [Metabacillus sp. SLBN-84]